MPTERARLQTKLPYLPLIPLNSSNKFSTTMSCQSRVRLRTAGHRAGWQAGTLTELLLDRGSIREGSIQAEYGIRE